MDCVNGHLLISTGTCGQNPGLLKKIKGEFPNVFRRGSHEGVCALHQVKVGAVDMVNDEL